ncbi:AbrB/MazE/SpoVT family DNA-binding domain-containing protein [Candidatus Woesearchaeota archaeon]|nr:AbrB/MazE/SpoVT family DNA-binding domain-containing protein [Candidatus Woesearchaeota archaeon]
MIEIEVVARKWGNSVGIALPKDVIEKANIKLNKELKLFIPDKRTNLSKVFGTLTIKEPTQKILDKIREGEN